MGANLSIITLDEKIKTVEAARKKFDQLASDSRYESGHSYSGEIGMIHSLRFVDRTFATYDEFSKYMGDKDKGDGILARVAVIRRTKPLEAANTAVYDVTNELYRAKLTQVWNPTTGKWVARRVSQSLVRRLEAKLEKAQTKYQTLLAAQLQKSTRTQFILGGWCSS